jgi:hypothetical protein
VGLGQDLPDAPSGGLRVLHGVGPDDPPAGGQGGGFHHARQPEPGGGRPGVVARPDDPEVGLADPGLGERLPHRHLVAGGRHRPGRVVGEAEPGRGQGGGHGAAVVDGHDGVDGLPAGGLDDGGGGALRVVEVDHQGPVAHGAGQGLGRLGADHHLGVEASRGGQEVRRLVGGGRQQEEDPGHAGIMAPDRAWYGPELVPKLRLVDHER